jgi:hypothetical protein
MADSIAVNNDLLTIRFDRFDLEEYRVFLKTKLLPESRIEYDRRADAYTVTAPARFAHLFGANEQAADVPLLPLPEYLHDYQRWIVRDLALPVKRFAVWADTGLGKTAIILEWARQVNHRTGGRVLILSPLNIIRQTVDEAAHWYGDGLSPAIIPTREKLEAWCESGTGIAITNYEKFIPRDREERLPWVMRCSGIAMDESSVLKTGGGKIKWCLVKSCKGVEYKLSCTATPAPNDPMEYASQAAWLEKIRSENDVIWTYFKKLPDGSWKLSRHAEDAFYRFMSGWSIYLRNPAAYGFRDNLKDLPAPVVREHVIPPTPAQRAKMFRVPDMTGQMAMFVSDKLDLKSRIKLSQIAKGFQYLRDEAGRYERIESNKPAKIAELARDELAADRQVLVWTVYDAEGEILRDEFNRIGIGDAEILSGKTSMEKRAAILDRFRKGEIRCLVSKPVLLGHGLNFQFCRAMIFSGWTDSFESFYQAVRRAYRYGQTETVYVHIPVVPELEGLMLENIQKKEQRFLGEVTRMERSYVKVTNDQGGTHANA